jgi:histidinol-phosphate phosphatase family protein
VNKCVFLDRDGTIAKDVPYCSSPEQFELLPGAGEGIKRLNNAGFKVIIFTNQSGIGRGYFSEKMLGRIHEKMKADLAEYGAHIDGIYYCPHHPDDNCDCRKPKPNLIIKAAKEHNIDLSQSFIIGDSVIDIEAGRAVGCVTILLAHGGKSIEQRADYVVDTLLAASRLLPSNELQLRPPTNKISSHTNGG